jgi:hypothetical protein
MEYSVYTVSGLDLLTHQPDICVGKDGSIKRVLSFPRAQTGMCAKGIVV